MPVTQQTPVISYTASGSSTVFAFPFRVLAASDLVVTLNGIATSVGFTVTGLGVVTGGAVTFTIAPPAGTLVKLQRSIPRTRSTDYVEGGPLRADTLDGDLDRIVMMLQDVEAGVPVTVQNYASQIKVSVYTATQDQTVFALTDPYTLGAGTLELSVNGADQILGVDYSETSTAAITFLTALNAGDMVQARVLQVYPGVATTAALVGYGAGTTVSAALDYLNGIEAAQGETTVSNMAPWLAGAVSSSSKIWLYGSQLWTGYVGALPVAPSFSTGYLYRKPSEGWTPEQFGATGLGPASPDTAALTRMFATVPTGARILLTTGAHYHNNLPSGLASNWVIARSCTIVGWGVKLSRRASLVGDDQCAVLDIRASNVSVIGDIDIDGMEPTAIPVNSSGTALGTTQFARALASAHGVIVQNSAQNVNIDVTRIHHNNFNVLVWNGAGDFRLRGRLDWSGQVYPVAGADLQLGAGIKLAYVNVFDVDVRGTNNTNACVEIEPACNNGKVKMYSDIVFSSGLTITASTNIDLVSVTANNGGYGVQIVNGSSGIRGTINGDGNAFTTCSINSFGGSPVDVTDIRLDICARNCAGSALRIAQEGGATGVVKDYDITVQARNCAPTGNGIDLIFANKGVIRGKVAGSSLGVGLTSVNGVRLLGMDLNENTTPYYASGSSVFDLEQVMTPNSRITALSTQNITIAKNLTSTGIYQFGPMTDIVLNSSNVYLPSIATTAGGTFTNSIYSNSNVITRKP